MNKSKVDRSDFLKPLQILLAIGFASIASAQESELGNIADIPGASDKSKPEDAWTLVLNKFDVGATRRRVIFGPDGMPIMAAERKTAVQIRQERARAAVDYQAAAATAKEFYMTYPGHSNAKQAKKLEASAGLLGVTDDNPGQEKDAQRIAEAYRNDKSNPAADRFEIAMLSERVKSRAKLGGIFGTDPSELEKLADRLQVEFGELPEAYYFYASVARMSDVDTAGRMAAKLLKASGAPADAKAEAQSVVDREKMIGKPIDLQLPTTDGKILDLSRPSGKPTLLYVWSTNTGPQTLTSLGTVRKLLPPDAQIIYLALGRSGAHLEALAAQTPLPGTICFQGVGTSTAVETTLKIRHTPYVFVIDPAGKLAGYGPAALVASVLKSALR